MEQELITGSERYREYLESSIWRDQRMLLEERIATVRMDLDTSDTMEKVKYVQGRIFELRQLIDAIETHFLGLILEQEARHATDEQRTQRSV